MMDVEVKSLIAFRIQRALDTLDDVEYNMAGEKYHVAANRMYYACYYAATALFIKYGSNPHSHMGVKTHVNKTCA